MKCLNKNLMTVCAAVLVLGLAGCGSSGDDEPVIGGTTGDGAPDGTPDGAPAATTVGDLFTTAYNSEADAVAAAKEAKDAVEAAMDATGLITTLGAKGDSMTATENAQAVLAAPAKVGEAVTKAKTCLRDCAEKMP